MDKLDLRLPFTGDAGKALDHIAETLAQNGFKITKRTAYEVELTGPEKPQHVNEIYYLGPSRVHVEQASNSLQLKADMSATSTANRIAVRAVSGIIAVTAIGIGAFLFSVFGWRGLSQPAPMMIFGFFMALLAVAWVRLRTLLPRAEKNIVKAYETLLHDAVMLANGR